MKLERKEIKSDHLSALFKLKVHPEQGDFVAPNEITLAQQAYEAEGTFVWGLWDGDTVVGLIAMINLAVHPDIEEGDDTGSAYIWRLMIGQDFQGRGYGSAALAEAEAVTREWGLPRVTLSFVDHPKGPEKFYLKAGFARTGRISDGEVVMSRTL